MQAGRVPLLESVHIRVTTMCRFFSVVCVFLFLFFEGEVCVLGGGGELKSVMLSVERGICRQNETPPPPPPAHPMVHLNVFGVSKMCN